MSAPNEKTGLVPCVILTSEAGLGLRAGETRGLSPETAEAMVDRKHARYLTAAELKAADKPAAKTGPAIPPTV